VNAPRPSLSYAQLDDEVPASKMCDVEFAGARSECQLEPMSRWRRRIRALISSSGM
jgi:hypothetical protein